MKQNKITDNLFDLTKSITNGYQTGGLYGRLLELKDLQLYTQKRINEIQKEIDELPNNGWTCNRVYGCSNNTLLLHLT